MATMKPPNLPSSGQIRRLIGVYKSTLSRNVNTLNQLLLDYGLTLDNTNPIFGNLYEEEVRQLFVELIQIHSTILKTYTKLSNLHDEWQTLRTQSSEEEAVYQDYLDRLGDYTQDIASAVSTLEKLDNIMHTLEQDAENRGISLPRENQTPGSPGEEQDVLQTVSNRNTTVSKTPMQNKDTLLLGNPFPIQPNPSMPYTEPQLIHHGTYTLPVSSMAPYITSPSMVNVPPVITTTANPPYGYTQPNNGIPQMHISNAPYHGMFTLQGQNQLYGPSELPRNHQGMQGMIMPGQNSVPEQGFNFVDASLLTKLELPSFDGNILEYPEFWARFTTLVGNKYQLDGATKLTLLKSSLKGRALSTLQGLPLTNENYVIAVEILRTHFDNPATLRHTLYTKLANLPNCDENGKQLPSLYCKMLSLVRQYTSCSDDSREYGLAAILQNKLSKFVRSRIYDRNPNNRNLTPSELLQILTEIVRKEQALTNNRTETANPSEVYHVQVGAKGAKGKTDRRSHDSDDVARRKKPCKLCDSEEHRVKSCTQYITVSEKQKSVREKHLCVLCFCKHSVKECKKTFNCENCQGRHHVLLCQKGPKTTATPTNDQTNKKPYHRRPNSSNPHRNRKNQVVHFSNDSQDLYQDEDYVSNVTTNVENTDTVYTAATFNVPTRTQNAQVQKSIQRSVSEEDDANSESELEIEPLRSDLPTALMCVNVNLFNPENPENRITTRAFFDSGATKSYITKEMAEKLNLRGLQEEPLSVNTFARDESTIVMSCVHTLGIETTDGSDPVITNIRAVSKLTSSLQMVLATFGNDHTDAAPKISTEILWDKPQLLIGIDLFWTLILSDEFHFRYLPSGQRLLNTRIGYVVANKRLGKEYCFQSNHQELSLSNPAKHQQLEEIVEKFWQLESLGVMDDPIKTDDDKCLEIFHQTVKFNENEARYQVSLPFKISPLEIPSNRQMAFSRTIANWKFLSKNSEHLQKYHAIFEEQLQKGIIERVPEKDFDNMKCHYLAHFGVVSASSKTTKIRAVFDGSAKSKGEISINEGLFRGPVLLPQLAGILLRTRLARILLAADLEKAFLMVSLHDTSRDYTRFYWTKDPLKEPYGDNLIEYRFCRVPFGLISSPFLLEATIHYHLTSTGTPLSTALLQNTYVDNIFLDVSSLEHGKQMYKETKELFQKAGMNLREFVSSDSKLNSFLEFNEQSKVDEQAKILGIKWNTKSDCLTVTLPYTPAPTIWTKRKVLKETATIYDPLGLIVPVVLMLKIFLQNLWKKNYVWDEVLPDDLQSEWITMMNSRTMNKLTVSRRFLEKVDGTETYTLRVFCDASGAAYAAVGYLCINNSTGTTSHLLMAKSRLSPVSGNVTIPRLELQGLLIGARLMTYLRSELNLKIEKEYLWSDSRAALMWIKAGKDLPVFVRNRVKTINTLCPSTIIRHVPGTLNPADIASRGTNIEELMKDQQWWNGPSYICQPEDDFPADKSAVEYENSVTAEINNPATDNLATDVHVSIEVSESILPVNMKRFNTWVKLVNVLTMVFTFFKKLTKSKTIGSRYEAVHRLYFAAQNEYPPSQDQISQLRLFRKPGSPLWRCKSRLDNADLPDLMINPIYMPRESRITQLLILDYHFDNEHAGVNQTLSDLRQLFWIPKGRSTVQKIIHRDCYACKRKFAKPYTLPPFPQLPAERVQRPTYPFESCGTDYMGPYLYRNKEDALSKKYWLCLFTCLSTRAAYVYVITNQSASTFLHILRRFIAMNGCPKLLISDNAPCFKAVATCYNSLDTQSPEEKDLLDYCSRRQITFKFIPSHSPWQGGVYERLVGIFKTSFNSCVKNSILTMEQVETIAMEALAITNARPLTYHISNEMECVPLRPVDFLRPNAQMGAPQNG